MAARQVHPRHPDGTLPRKSDFAAVSSYAAGLHADSQHVPVFRRGIRFSLRLKSCREDLFAIFKNYAEGIRDFFVILCYYLLSMLKHSYLFVRKNREQTRGNSHRGSFQIDDETALKFFKEVPVWR